MVDGKTIIAQLNISLDLTPIILVIMVYMFNFAGMIQGLRDLPDYLPKRTAVLVFRRPYTITELVCFPIDSLFSFPELSLSR